VLVLEPVVAQLWHRLDMQHHSSYLDSRRFDKRSLSDSSRQLLAPVESAVGVLVAQLGRSGPFVLAVAFLDMCRICRQYETLADPTYP
jgi:hypothetical protein